MFCTNCGKKIYDGDRFCAHCGTKVRGEEAPKPQRQEIVFNPPFKVEAERRTTEIYRGFASEEPEEKPRRVTEPVNFDWNLDGFPAEKKKTEEINFNWDSVVERRNGRRAESRTASGAPVVDRIDIRHPAKEQETEGGDLLADLFVPKQRPERESLFVELPQQTETEEIPVLILPEKPAAEPEKPEIVPAAEPEKPETVPAAVPEPEPEEEPVDSFISVEDLERELFGENYHGLDSMSDDERVKNTAQLEKFYTYNQKNEAFQQLLDREYERLKHMEDQRQPDVESLEYTWAGKLFPAERRTESERHRQVLKKRKKLKFRKQRKHRLRFRQLPLIFHQSVRKHGRRTRAERKRLLLSRKPCLQKKLQRKKSLCLLKKQHRRKNPCLLKKQHRKKNLCLKKKLHRQKSRQSVLPVPNRKVPNRKKKSNSATQTSSPGKLWLMGMTGLALAVLALQSVRQGLTKPSGRR